MGQPLTQVGPSNIMVGQQTTPPTSLYTRLPYPGISNPLWGQPNMVNVPSQGPPPNQPPKQSYMGGPPIFNMQSQPTYGPTRVPMLHQYYQSPPPD